MLTFDPGPHVYRWNGSIVPNVTRVLSLVTDYSHIPAPVLAHAQAEGVAIHKTVELYAKDDLDEASLPQWLVPRLDAFKRFVAETGFVINASEQRVYHHRFAYAGQLDLEGTLQLRVGRKSVPTPAIVDVKRSFYAGRAIGLQLAAYDAACPRTSFCSASVPRRRYALQLRADGTYRLEPFTDPADMSNFLACLNVWRLREQMKLPIKEHEHA